MKAESKINDWNITRMECKAERVRTALDAPDYWNITRMECKEKVTSTITTA